METIETVKPVTTMKTINATKGEFVNLINGLFAVQDLQGKEFSLIVSKNISIIRDSLKDIEEAGQPSEEFMTLARKVNEISNEGANDAKERIDKLEEENKELVEARKVQMDSVAELMKNEMEVELNLISEEFLPENITAKQINSIEKIIE
tara:strand:- start:303 stop:752 length:450 start_codon:yes stop_codon:yes gene_type:complete